MTMMKNVRNFVIVFICAKLGEFSAAQNWQNDFDEPLNFDCPDGYAISRVQSYHDNGKEDRRWAFECNRPLRTDLGSVTCLNSGYVNDYDQDIYFDVLPYSLVLSGAHSVHDNGKEDRIWDFRCCGAIGGYCPYNCYYTGELNEYDGVLDYTVPDGYYIVGMWSHHDNGKEDRIWKFNVCQIGACVE